MEDVGIDIFSILQSEFPDLSHHSFIEVGSGTGRISVQLAKHGAKVVLLDPSEAALGISKSFFSRAGTTGGLVRASGFRIPCKSSSFDVVWNTGLIEHFLFDDQVRLLGEMLRVLKPAGTLVTFNPSHDGKVYRIGKYLLERTGRWHYGREIPIRSLKPHCEVLRVKLVREWNTSFDIQFYYFGKYGLPLQRFFRGRSTMNMMLARILGGYLKVSVIQKA